MRDVRQHEASDRSERDAMEARLRGIYERRVRGGGGAIADEFHPDCDYVIAGDPVTVPGAGRRIGRAAVLSAMRDIDIQFELSDLEVSHVLIDGAQAAVRWSVHVQGRATGGGAYVEFYDHLVFEDGLIRQFREFHDTATTARLTDE